MDEDTPASRASQAPRLVERAEADEDEDQEQEQEHRDVPTAEAPKTPLKVAEPSPAKARDVGALDRTTEDDLLATQTFFSQPPADHTADHWDSTAPAMTASSRRAMYAAVSIFSGSLLILCGYLIYTRLLMPVPAQLGTGSGMPAAVALTPVAQAEPAVIAPLPSAAPAVAAAPTPLPAPPAPAAPVVLEPALVTAAAQAAQPVAAAADPAAAAPAAAAPREAAPAAPPPAATAEPAAIAVAAPAPPTGEVAEMLKTAGALYKRNKRKQAREAYEQVLAVDPNASEALSRIAYLDLQAGDNDHAKQFGARAVEVDPTNAEGWIVLGAALESLRDRVGARDAYTKCAELGTGPYAHECKRLAR